MNFGYTKHICRTCYNCKENYCYLGKRSTFFIACKLWVSKNTKKSNPVKLNIIRAMNHSTEERNEYRRLYEVWAEVSCKKTDEIYDLQRQLDLVWNLYGRDFVKELTKLKNDLALLNN